MSDQLVINAVNLRKSYQIGGAEIAVLTGASLQVSAKEFVSIQGESGCGKTTFLNTLCGIEYPDSGYVEWLGEKISDKPRNALAKQRAAYVGFVFQSYHLVPEIDALQNILISARIAKGKAGTGDIDRAKELLERVGLPNRGSQLPSTLSGGERQRVAIARALMNEPRVLLADEPTGNLDEATGERIMDLLEELCSLTQTALVLVTHNKEHALRASRQLTLTHGNLDE